MDQVVEDLLSCLDDPALALLQWNEAFGVVQVCRQSRHLRCLEPPACSSPPVGLADSFQCAAQPACLSWYYRSSLHATAQLQVLQQMSCLWHVCG